MVKEWHAAAAHLAAHITPGRLELSLVCYLWPGDEDGAREILAGVALLPKLKNCHNRLRGAPDSTLRGLAQDAVPESIKNKNVCSVPYAFQPLPRDTRYKKGNTDNPFSRPAT